LRVVNLHLDHVSQPAREKQIKVVLDDAAQYQPELRQILTGDFNASAANQVYKMVKERGWKDTYTDIHGDAEPGFTVHEFQGENYTKKDKGRKIDFIFYKGDFKSTGAAIIKDNVNGRYPSDHYFVSANVNS
jgi:endonuclease/exonuclease/phosphatase family metal-dependent hydrolase